MLHLKNNHVRCFITAYLLLVQMVLVTFLSILSQQRH